MKRVKFLSLLVIGLLFLNCGGNGGGGSSSTTSPPATQSAAGIWNGTVYSNQAHTSYSVVGIIAENNQARFISSVGSQFSGIESTSGNTFTSQATAYAPLGSHFPDGSQIGTVNISGTVNSKVSITGTFSGVGDTGTLSLTYDSLYQRPSSFSLPSGTWTVSDSHLGYVTASINGSGQISASTNTGCTLSGNITLIDSSYNAYGISLNIASCGVLSGSYSGLATLSDTATQNDTLITGVSNSQLSITEIFSRSGATTQATTTAITNYMSPAYQTDKTSLGSDLANIEAQAAAQGSLCGGNMFVNAANVKVSHVQNFVNNALAYVQTTKNAGSPIDNPSGA